MSLLNTSQIFLMKMRLKTEERHTDLSFPLYCSVESGVQSKVTETKGGQEGGKDRCSAPFHQLRKSFWSTSVSFKIKIVLKRISHL